jgi:hypothetical protein
MAGGRLRLRVMDGYSGQTIRFDVGPTRTFAASLTAQKQLTRWYLWPAINCPGIVILAAPGVYTPQSPRESRQAIRTDTVALLGRGVFAWIRR